MKRDVNILIKLTKEEKERLKQKALDEGLTVSSYIRHKCIGKGGK